MGKPSAMKTAYCSALCVFLYRFLPSLMLSFVYWFVCFCFNPLNPPASQHVLWTCLLVFVEAMLELWVPSFTDLRFAHGALAERAICSK